MENELQNRQPTLFSELSNWNGQESKFRELFSADVLKDRDFLKLKLDHYNKLYYKYGGGARTTDDQAMVAMLHYQRRKMERTLYPGLLTRMVRRAFARIRIGNALNKENATLRSGPVTDGYNLPPLPPNKRQDQGQKQQPVIRQMPLPRQIRRNKHAKRSKGQSL